MKTIKVSKEILSLCTVRSKLASELTREEVADLMHWCDRQEESLWDEMTLQEILNVYRATAEWVSFEDWADEDRAAAYKAWNSAIIKSGNKMQSI